MRTVIFILFLVVNTFATQLEWLDDYQQALQKAQKEDKLVYIFISSSSCQWCTKFEETTLKDEKIKNRLSKGYVTLHLVRDFDTIPKKFKTAPVPRHYFTNSKGEILYNSLGYRKVECFDSFMDNAEEKLKKTHQK